MKLKKRKASNPEGRVDFLGFLEREVLCPINEAEGCLLIKRHRRALALISKAKRKLEKALEPPFKAGEKRSTIRRTAFSESEPDNVAAPALVDVLNAFKKVYLDVKKVPYKIQPKDFVKLRYVSKKYGTAAVIEQMDNYVPYAEELNIEEYTKWLGKEEKLGNIF